MFEIRETVEDYGSGTFNNKTHIALNANVAMNPYTITFPISWTGIINNEKVEIILKNNECYHSAGYDWSGLPVKYSHLQSDIVKIINEHMHRTLD